MKKYNPDDIKNMNSPYDFLNNIDSGQNGPNMMNDNSAYFNKKGSNHHQNNNFNENYQQNRQSGFNQNYNVNRYRGEGRGYSNQQII
jgi:hypothetical protein